MWIIFGFNAHSIWFSFFSTLIKRFSGLADDFYFYFPRKLLWICLRFYFLDQKFQNAHYIKFKDVATQYKWENTFLWTYVYRVRKHWSGRRNWEGFLCHVVIRSWPKWVTEFQPRSIHGGSGIRHTNNESRAFLLTFVANIGNDARVTYFKIHETAQDSFPLESLWEGS